jgi:drug/metabolite transporter (DMT)-like permease
MKTQHRSALLALATAGALWGLTVPLSKLSLGWLGPAWLTVARFALSAPLLAVLGRRGLRQALAPRVAGAGAIGFGAVVLLQNAGIEHTSVSHAAVLVGAVPVLVALIAAGLGQAKARPLAWGGYGLALAGIALVAGSGGAGATMRGDLLVLASAVVSAAMVVVQPRLLAGRDVAAGTAVQFAAAALVALPIAAFTEGAPRAPATTIPVLTLAALALAGTLLPFWLFAFGQARVPAQLAGAYINLEPVVGAAVGWLAFGNTAAVGQVAGAVAVLAGIALSTLSPADVNVNSTTSAPGGGRRGSIPGPMTGFRGSRRLRGVRPPGQRSPTRCTRSRLPSISPGSCSGSTGSRPP